jgi:formylglycine-generating enzyme required for sulfatase activity
MNKFSILITTLLVLLLASCQRENPIPPQEPNPLPPVGTLIFQPNVIKVDSVPNLSLTALSTTALTFNATAAQPAMAKVGDILMGNPSTLSPNGYLRKVTAITAANGTVTYQTTPATLNEAIKECNIKQQVSVGDWFMRTPSPRLETNFSTVVYDNDQNMATQNDQVRVNGNVSVEPYFIFELRKSSADLSIEYGKFGFGYNMTRSADLGAAVGANVSKEVQVLPEFRSTPILVGGVIWITPTAELLAGVEGSIGAQMSLGENTNNTQEFYTEYKNGSYTMGSTNTQTHNNFVFNMQGTASVETYLKAKFKMKLYEFVGVYGTAKAFIKGEASYSPAQPTVIDYCLKVGAKGGIGVSIDVFGNTMGQAETEVTFWEQTPPASPTFQPCGSINLGGGGNATLPEMVAVQGGTFTMGCTAEQGTDCYSDESPAHQVTLNTYKISKYEITNAQYAQMLNARGNQTEGGTEWIEITSSYCRISQNGSTFTADAGYENHPVVEVSWYGAKAYADWLSSQTGQAYALPTEAQWEFAARGGNASQGYKYAGSNTIDNVAWYTTNSGSTTHAVGTKAPNELGLYDMSGNVWEWCNDWYGTYINAPLNNPSGPATGSHRVLRGGSWLSSAVSCRVAFRADDTPAYRLNNWGFRLVSSS